MEISKERLEEILDEALAYIDEVVNDNELIYRVLKNGIGMSEYEIKYFGF